MFAHSYGEQQSERLFIISACYTADLIYVWRFKKIIFLLIEAKAIMLTSLICSRNEGSVRVAVCVCVSVSSAVCKEPLT